MIWLHCAIAQLRTLEGTLHMGLVLASKVRTVIALASKQWSDGHYKTFCTKAITISDNFKTALGDTIIEKSQFLKAMSVIDKLSPINVVVNFLRAWRSFFYKSYRKNVFLDFSKERSSGILAVRGIKQNKERFFKLQQDFTDTVYSFQGPTWLISSSLSSYHEKAAEALCLERFQTRLGDAFVSEFSG